MSNQKIEEWFNDDYEIEEYPIVKPGDPEYTFSTPCNRLLNLSIHGENSSKIIERADSLNGPFTIEESQNHPNLEMSIDASKRIIMQDKSKEITEMDKDFDSSDLLSIVVPLSAPFSLDDEDEYEDDSEEQNSYDPSDVWLNNIYHSNESEPINYAAPTDSVDLFDDQENRPPRNWRSRNEMQIKKRYISKDEERLPLREITTVDSRTKGNQEQSPSKKRLVLDGKTHKFRLMRALSPPKQPSKLKNSTTVTSETTA